MEIRFATEKDFEIFLPSKEEFLKEYDISKKSVKFIKDEFNEYLKQIILLSIEGKELAGYLIGQIEKKLYEKYGYIIEVFTKKKFRGRKISTKLKNNFLEVLRGKGINLCRVEVKPDNPAQKVYKKWGFKIDKHRMRLKFS